LLVLNNGDNGDEKVVGQVRQLITALTALTGKSLAHPHTSPARDKLCRFDALSARSSSPPTLLALTR